MRISVCLSGLVVSALAAIPAAAHHGWAGQGSEEFELSGTVHTALSLAGPHATMQIKDAQGQVWDLTLAPPPRTSAAGLAETTIPVGAEVTIGGHRSSDPKRFEVKTERVTYDGKLYNVYPNRT
jgi:hypothetical protein